MSARLPRAAYVHVPFCRRRCGYCNFTLVAGRDDLILPYLDAVERELSLLEVPREVDTLFLGGGTPTHLPAAELSRLLSTARRWFPLAEGYEWSIEANPSDLDADRIAVLHEHGVTRISLGAQSFHHEKLRALDRDHDADTIQRSVARARGRFRSLSIDLIFGVPGETLDIWKSDLAAATALQPDHISAYGLTYERGTALWSRWRKGGVERLGEEAERAMYECSMDTLALAGFEHYEISNYARPGHRCQHNEVYWAADEYYAVGAGAARYVDGRREVNHRSTTTYIRRMLAGLSPVAESESLTPADRAREAIVIGMRRIGGVQIGEFKERTGFEIDALLNGPLERFIAQGLIERVNGTIRLTREGIFVSDSIWPYFL